MFEDQIPLASPVGMKFITLTWFGSMLPAGLQPGPENKGPLPWVGEGYKLPECRGLVLT